MFHDDFSDYPRDKQTNYTEPDEAPFTVLPIWAWVVILGVVCSVLYWGFR